MKKTKLMLGDNIESLKKLPDNSIDSVVTDPPYGLSFMNKKWDYDVPSTEFWMEVYRVLKPGGHVLSFGGTRTYHRMVVNIEDAGFEIRDQIQWIYGSGFPKSHNIGKAVDKLEGNDREDLGKNPAARPCSDAGDYETNTKWKTPPRPNISKGTSPYEGWGTALKPANEPICVARKPLSEKSVAENVLKWGTGGINVDGCRISGESWGSRPNTNKPKYGGSSYNDSNTMNIGSEYNTEGRFPANIILECICDEVIKGENNGLKKETFENYGNGEYGKKDGRKTQPTAKEIEGTWYKDKGDIHTDPNCPCRLLDEQSGESKSIKSKRGGAVDSNSKTYNWNNGDDKIIDKYDCGFSDKGGASRFFYQAKVSKAERNMGLDGFEDVSHSQVNNSKLKLQPNGEMVENTKNTITKNNHPTVKPINLMAYLCRLITPENGICLDPFMGSGSTGVAAQLEGFRFVGMEMDPEYFKIASARIDSYEKYKKFKK